MLMTKYFTKMLYNFDIFLLLSYLCTSLLSLKFYINWESLIWEALKVYKVRNNKNILFVLRLFWLSRSFLETTV